MELRPPIPALLTKISALPAAQHILVFGSVARMEAKPVDLDVALYLPGCENWDAAKSVHEKTIRTLLRLASCYYGWLDPFVITKGKLVVRNAEANGWIFAKNAQKIQENILKDGRPILDLLPAIALAHSLAAANEPGEETGAPSPA